MKHWIALVGLVLLLLAIVSSHARPAHDPFNPHLAIKVGPNGRFNIGVAPDPTTGAATASRWEITYRNMWSAQVWFSRPNLGAHITASL